MALAQAAHCWQNFRSQTIEQVGRWQKMTSRCDFNTNSAYPSWIWTEGKIHCGLVACRSQTQPFICPMDNLQCNEAKVNMQEAGMSLNRDWGGGEGGGLQLGNMQSTISVSYVSYLLYWSAVSHWICVIEKSIWHTIQFKNYLPCSRIYKWYKNLNKKKL